MTRKRDRDEIVKHLQRYVDPNLIGRCIKDCELVSYSFIPSKSMKSNAFMVMNLFIVLAVPFTILCQ